jgi:aminomethyltransferase
MNLYGQDMDERVSPLDAGSHGPSISRAARLRRQGALRATASARIPGLMLLDGGGVLRGHQKVAAARRGRGHERHVLAHARMSIALARLPRGTAPGDTVRVQVRDKPLARAS